MIKDSGERTEFTSGAVRDMKQGKGRCDLMPLGVLTHCFDDAPAQYFRMMEKYNETKNTDYLYCILNTLCHLMFEGCPSTMALEVAIHFQEGAEKYGEHNWQKGIPTWSYVDSATRHYLKWLRDDEDERHDRACVWNIMCLIWTIEHDEVTK